MTPEWHEGKPANLAAAAMDAGEWLKLMACCVDDGVWHFSQAGTRAKLEGCRAALAEMLKGES